MYTLPPQPPHLKYLPRSFENAATSHATLRSIEPDLLTGKTPLPVAIMTNPAFVPALAVGASTLTPSRALSLSPRAAPVPAAPPTGARMLSGGYSPIVDEFFAKDVRSQYIAAACPSGVPSVQCIEGATFDEPYESRTLKRQSQLRFRQLPVAVRLHNMYETRKWALAATHGCAHEEERVLGNPMLASAMAIGQAEKNRACSRYIESSGPAESMMVRSVENFYSKAVNGSGTFTPACTDGQAKYEAYLAQNRGKSAEFRAKHYSAAAKAGAKFAAKKLAIARNHICVYEDGLYAKYPRMAGSMRPAFGYYTPFVSAPSNGRYQTTIERALDSATLAALSKIGTISPEAAWAAANKVEVGV